MSKIQLITSNLGSQLIEKLEGADTVCILSSFVIKSGVHYLKEALKRAAQNGADIKICTGDYLYITQPEALEELLSIDERISVRIWKSNGVSFHPKAYLFQSNENDTLFIGSSNLSRSALNHGVEWNLSVLDEKEVFHEALTEFLNVFYSDRTVPLNKETLSEYRTVYDEYHRKYPNLSGKWTELEELDLMLPSIEENQPQVVLEDPVEYESAIQPRFAQIEALEELNRTLEEEYNKALVVMATGLGKTYLAGFFSQNFKKILFVAHREEILYQARDSFKRIMPEKQYGIYNGKIKESQADAVFASIYTLSIKKHLEQFQREEFDLIIVDEFHHAAADSYRRALDYFHPRFLLGITATPDRNDNRDVYAICDGNVAFRLDFLEAIYRRWLAPFKYLGVYDDTDYSQITWLGNRYDEEELLLAQLRKELALKVLRAWEKNKQTKTLGFCSSIRQADFLSNFFNKHGHETVSLHSQQMGINRKNAISQLSKGEIDIIFTVDLFNEGVDIPSVDTLLFVRPTESLSVFTQQIGRGLRLHPGKEACVIIDLIGNYRNADIKLSLFDTQPGEGKTRNIQPTLPEFCEITLDVNVINLLQEMSRKRQPRREKLLNDYLELKKELGRRPTYLELHLQGRSDSPQYKQEFQSYFGFLKWAEELTDREVEVFDRYENWFIEGERTGMAKSYKMVVLQAMLERGKSRWYNTITSKQAAPFFHQYLMEKEHRKRIDFSDKGAQKLWNYDEKGVSKLIATMPMTKWSGSSKRLISYENDIFKLNFDVAKEDEEILYNWTKEICEYRLHYHFERKAKNFQTH
ncbi:superfamily II DNA or RNA helicase/HKD family nuclease [Bacillus sp. SORGH_AS 510]|uniref:DEAD/DEAH box helicase family protein n=1 Tax=Bacillus sp. SORGH_AS_0510 TaxID=3041771 RepID=UPI0027872258|nr:DEAD/DEAH box helicase family protein [Bacillus sp. SORGH_AS_0510]MDQ1146067.1 superfamily II DNA or RNA helicase/HKD family nuclease [Bacillus sp. SORGH_AS_0510]